MAIHQLPNDVVDKIAAGEVLDRPANLIKELIENSLDAGADELEVEFAQGGREVRVLDNGSGMSPEDLPLSILRHATSKIWVSEDLFRLQSFGFRGEALASVAAVSRMTIISCRAQDKKGHRLDVEFGEPSAVVPTAARQGTEVRVRDLFENVPARLRFLKSEAAEHGQIRNTLKALALGRHDIGFRVLCRGELVFHWPKRTTWMDRARDVLHEQTLYAGGMDAGEGLRAEVLVSSPQETHNVNRSMWFFVQGRWVQDRSLTAAVMEGYRNLLMHGEYPTAIVRLSLSPEDVDVNVHPTKAQVKFRDGQDVFRITARSIRQVLESAPWLGEAERAVVEPAPRPSFRSSSQNETDQGHTLRFGGADFERTQYSGKAFPLADVRQALANVHSAPATEEAHHATQDLLRATPAPGPDAFLWSGLQVVGQLNHTYIVAQSAVAFYLVDQHAAHERVLFERLMHSFRAGHMDVQNLLLPLVFDFTAEEVEALLRHRETAEKIGLSLDRMGPESVAVQAIPALVSENAVAEALRKLAHELLQNSESMALETAVGEVFASMACHSATRAGQSLSVEQMHSLLAQMDEFPLSSFCPHGRPVFSKKTFREIDRDFGRIL